MTNSLKDAVSMAYNFETKEAEVVFPEGAKVNVPEVTRYFEEATDAKVRRILLFSGRSEWMLSRDQHGKWVTIS